MLVRFYNILEFWTKLQSDNKDLFLGLLIFKQENACSQMYVDPSNDKCLAAKFFKLGNDCFTQINLRREDDLGRSLIKILNSKGPRTEPWGTPL